MVIYNSLTRRKEEFVPLNPPKVGMYTCGPTVYYYLTIGNFRTFVTSDVLRRTLSFLDYKVKYVMNITDVGHLTGDNLGDADLGEDRLERAAQKERKTAWDVAHFYTEAFLADIKKLNISPPDILCRATEHIDEQIELIKRLEEKRLIYTVADGVYFDTGEYEKLGYKYGELSTMKEANTRARVEENPDKRNQRDFALWKFSKTPGERQMEWESPWGLGFPGWHIECSAMAMKYLGESFDLHLGGEDLRQTHHPNEIAQSEGATGKQFVKYWVHTTFLLVGGKRMGKSLGNAYAMQDVLARGFEPLSLRYLYLGAHYRDPLNFTWEALKAAQTAYKRLAQQVAAYKHEGERVTLTREKEDKMESFKAKFRQAVEDDLNTPQALAVVWEVLKSNIPSTDKRDLILAFDGVLGLDLANYLVTRVTIGEDILKLAQARWEAKMKGDFKEADRLRNEILKKGFLVIDREDGFEIQPVG